MLLLLAGGVMIAVLSVLFAAHSREDARKLAIERDRAFEAEKAGAEVTTHALHQTYHAKVRVAQLQLIAGQPFLAREQLLDTQPELRGWEWHALMAALPQPLMEMECSLKNASCFTSTMDGRFVIVSSSHQMVLLDAGTRRELDQWRFAEQIHGCAVSEDGRRIAVLLRRAGNTALHLRVITRDGSPAWEQTLKSRASMLWEPLERGGALLCLSDDDTPGAAPGMLMRLEAHSGRVLHQREFQRGEGISERPLVPGISGRLVAVRRDYASFELLRLPTLETIASTDRKSRALIRDVLVDEMNERMFFAQQAFVFVTEAAGTEPDRLAWLALRKAESPTGENREQVVRRLNRLPDGRWIALGDDLRRIEGGLPQLSAAVPDLKSLSIGAGRRLSLMHGGRIAIYDDAQMIGATQIASSHAHTGYGGRRVAVSPDSQTLAISSQRRGGMCYTPLRQPLDALRVRLPERDDLNWTMLPAFHPDGSVIAWGADQVEAQRFDGRAISAQALPVAADAWSAAASADGRWMAFGTRAGVQIVDWSTKSIVREHALAEGPFGVFAGEQSGVFYALGRGGVLHRVGGRPLRIHLPDAIGKEGPPVAAWHAATQRRLDRAELLQRDEALRHHPGASGLAMRSAYTRLR